MKYEIKHSCGHVETVNLVGKHDDRERRIAWLESQPCQECRRAAEQEHAQQVAEEYALPDLVGSEKQVAWANKIRASMISQYEFAEKNGVIHTKKDGVKLIYVDAVNNMLVSDQQIAEGYQALLNHNSASWWIDYRGLNMMILLMDEIKEISKHANDVPEPEAEPAAEQEPASDNNSDAQDKPVSICPEHLNKQGEAVIIVSPEEVSVKYQKDDQFRAVVKSLGYSWDSDSQSWYKSIGVTTGSAEDRAAEVANKLLLAGFAVNVPNSFIKVAAERAMFEPEYKRWISLYNDIGITIRVEYGNDDIYKAARKIQGSKWERGYGVVVPAESFAEIRDFAEVCEYRITPGAEKALKEAEEAHQQKLAGAVKVAEPVKQEHKSVSDKLEEKLNVSGVIDDLRDDN